MSSLQGHNNSIEAARLRGGAFLKKVLMFPRQHLQKVLPLIGSSTNIYSCKKMFADCMPVAMVARHVRCRSIGGKYYQLEECLTGLTKRTFFNQMQKAQQPNIAFSHDDHILFISKKKDLTYQGCCYPPDHAVLQVGCIYFPQKNNLCEIMIFVLAMLSAVL